MIAIDPDTLLRGRDKGGWLSLRSVEQPQALVPLDLLPDGDGLLVSSGGSSGCRQICLQPWSHFDQSALATAFWLEEMGLVPSELFILNPLPLHHVSGLMSWWRSRCWGACHEKLPPILMKQPSDLLQFCEELPQWNSVPSVVSLVPTQLHRLLAHPAGLSWLRSFAVVWVGGAALSEADASQARSYGVRLAPCYGATETAAMVTAVPPDQFLAGEAGCGAPLVDVELKLDTDLALKVRTSRLAIARWSERSPEQLQSVRNQDGWWRSGDAASLSNGLHIHGRLDGAIHSGGETVFPEELEARLMEWVQQHNLAIESLLLVAEPDPEWGATLVGLVRPSKPSDHQQLLDTLRFLCSSWPSAERPRRWLICKELSVGPLGKWQRGRWRNWLNS